MKKQKKVVIGDRTYIMPEGVEVHLVEIAAGISTSGVVSAVPQVIWTTPNHAAHMVARGEAKLLWKPKK